MNHGSLFSGIGGFDLAAEWMGWENVFHCEWNPFGQKVLKHYWPNAISYNDITKTDFTIHRGTIDILTGGFPCQPYSSAGKRLGKEDERHLWPEMLRAIREIQPRWIVGENVLGLVNWNGGMVFEEVQADLEAEGYEVQPYVLPAAAVNAPHRRDRVWFVAHSSSNGYDAKSTETNNSIRKDNQQSGTQRERTIKGLSNEQDASNTNNNGLNECNNKYEINAIEAWQYAQRDFEQGNGNGDATNSNSVRLEQCKDGTKMGRGQTEMGRQGSEFANAIETNGEIQNTSNSSEQRLERRKWRTSKRTRFTFNIANWHNFPSVSPICSRNDGLSNRLDGITFSKWRNESIKAGGNAIVPQVVYQIFKAIELYGIQNPSKH
jgi:DNA (cytosine-5)-methyltransferase 1